MCSWWHITLIAKCTFIVKKLKDIMKIDRFEEIPKLGLFCDLVWADPIEDSKGKTEKMIIPNSVRGCSYYFGY